MRGVLSRRPAAWVARILIAGELLLMVTVVLLLGSATTLDDSLKAIAVAVALLAAGTFVFALLGERAFRKERRNGR